MRLSLLCLLALFIVSSCTTSVSFSGLRPADVSLPGEVKSLVLVNRYKPEKKNAWLNVLEGIFTREMPFADAQGVQRALEGLSSRLVSGPKFTIHIANEELAGSGTGKFPPPLTQEDVQRLCNQYQADAVIALEAFDSDISVVTEPRQNKRTENGVEIIDNYFEAIETVQITMGWRLYSKASGAIIDEHRLFSARSFSNAGKTADLARKGLLFPGEAIRQTGFEGGDAYGIRIAPSWVTYNREIYTRAKRFGSMKRAGKMARRGDWKEAADIWEKLAAHPQQKVARRAAYNRAVASEFLGNYDEALQWARKAADKFGSKKANIYISVLKSRLAELDRLDQQMKDTN